MIEQLHKSLLNLRHEETGLYIASSGQHYQKVWVRDNFYCSLPDLKNNPERYKQTYHSLLDFYIKSENNYKKLEWLIKEPHNKAGYRYPHPRLDYNLNELWEPWGYKQLDTIGELFFGIWLGENEGIEIIRNQDDIDIINKMVQALKAIEYWHDADSGIWEENEEVRSSSIGAVVAGLEALQKLGFDIDQELICNGRKALNDLLPWETPTRYVDLALLSLIYPFNVVSDEMANIIIKNIKAFLVRDRGIIRYLKDKYYNINGEMEWCFGFAFLCLALYQLGNIEEAQKYKDILISKCVLEDFKVPEGFYANTDIPNDNSDLGWAIAMTILVLEKEWI